MPQTAYSAAMWMNGELVCESAWPIIGPGTDQLSIEDVRPAMSISGRTRHYRLREIQARHWRGLASRVCSSKLWQRMQELVAAAATA
jgi:serine/threonine-protein kinase HipA